jgi:hypothetical protein
VNLKLFKKLDPNLYFTSNDILNQCIQDAKIRYGIAMFFILSLHPGGIRTRIVGSLMTTAPLESVMQAAKIVHSFIESALVDLFTLGDLASGAVMGLNSQPKSYTGLPDFSCINIPKREKI